MPYYKAVFDLNRPVEVKIPEERSIHTKMSTNPFYDEPPLDYIDFLAAIDLQDELMQAASFGGIANTEALRTQERVVDGMVSTLRGFVTVKANGNTGLILASGFRHTKSRTPVGDMPKVAGVRSKFTDVSGQVKVRWQPIYGKQFYELEYRMVQAPKPTPVPPLPDPPPPADTNNTNPWKMISCATASFVLNDLTPLQHYEVRVRAKGKEGYGGYSDIIIILVI